MRAYVLLTMIAALAGCANMRGAYQADVVVDNQRAGCVRYEGAVETDFAVACGLTGIFYGGACWGYISMPHDDQVRVMRSRALAKLRERGVANAQLVREDARRLSWDGDAPEVLVVEQNVQTCDTIRIAQPGTP